MNARMLPRARCHSARPILGVKLASISDSQLGDPELRRRRALCEAAPGREMADTEAFVCHVCDFELGSFEVDQFHAVSLRCAVFGDYDIAETGCHIQFRSPGCRGGYSWCCAAAI
jgi:hypothetical protein